MLPGCFSHLSYCSEYERLLSSLPKRCPKWPAYPKNGIYLPNIRMTITGNRIFTIEQRRRSLSTRTRLSMQFHPAKKEREMPKSSNGKRSWRMRPLSGLTHGPLRVAIPLAAVCSFMSRTERSSKSRASPPIPSRVVLYARVAWRLRTSSIIPIASCIP